MRAKIIIASLILTVSLISCNNKENKDNNSEQTTDVAINNTNNFKVTLDLLLQKNDTLHLYYTEDGSIDFKEESSIWLPVLGKSTNQQVVFELPKDIYPTQMRMDFGVNKENKEIKLNNIKFDYMDKSATIVESDILNYFRADESSTVFDNATRIIKRKDDSKTTASLYPHQDVLGKKLQNFGK